MDIREEYEKDGWHSSNILTTKRAKSYAAKTMGGMVCDPVAKDAAELKTFVAQEECTLRHGS